MEYYAKNWAKLSSIYMLVVYGSACKYVMLAAAHTPTSQHSCQCTRAPWKLHNRRRLFPHYNSSEERKENRSKIFCPDQVRQISYKHGADSNAG